MKLSTLVVQNSPGAPKQVAISIDAENSAVVTALVLPPQEARRLAEMISQAADNAEARIVSATGPLPPQRL